MSETVFFTPRVLDDALEILDQQHQGLEILAGGTDLWPRWTAERQKPARVLSLHRLEALRQLHRDGELLRIGAAVTHSELVRSPLVRSHCPALAAAAATIGAVQIQNRGTIGGNLVNASPAADLPPPLVAAGAELELASSAGKRRLPLDAFNLGYRKIDLRPGELLAAVLVPPLPDAAREFFQKVGTRRAQAISKVMGAGRLELDEAGRLARAGLAFGSVAPVVARLEPLEQWLVGRRPDAETAAEAGQRASQLVQPIDDLRSSADYRRYIVGRLVRNWVLEMNS